MSGDMSEFITDMTAQFSSANLWGSITGLVPLIGTVGLFALALYFTRRTTKGATKGKLKF